MKIALATVLVLITCQAFAITQTLDCGKFRVEIPQTKGEVPVVSGLIEVEIAIFSLKNSNVVLVAMDAEDNTRVRLSLSAQLNAKTKKYVGQFIQDLGGSQLQIENGPISCSLLKQK
jgi:hypothetical protein